MFMHLPFKRKYNIDKVIHTNMIKTILVIIIFYSITIESETYNYQFETVTTLDNKEIRILQEIIDDISFNFPSHSSWNTDTYKNEIKDYINNLPLTNNRYYKIELPINLGECPLSYGVCYDYSKELLRINRLEVVLNRELNSLDRLKVQNPYNKYSKIPYRSPSFNGRKKILIPRSYYRQNFSNLTLNIYFLVNINNLAVEPRRNNVTIIDLLLLDQDNNVAFSSNNSFLTKVYEPDNDLTEDSNDVPNDETINLTTFYTKSENNQGDKYKKARSLSTSTAKKMGDIYSILDKSNPDLVFAEYLLMEILNTQESLQSYDTAVVWNALAYIYMLQEELDLAKNAYENVINEDEVTLGIRNSALYTLAKLKIANNSYDDAVDLLLEWMIYVDEITAESYFLLGQAYYFKNDLISAAESILLAFNLIDNSTQIDESHKKLILLIIDDLEDSNTLNAEQYIKKIISLIPNIKNLRSLPDTDGSIAKAKATFKAGGLFFRDGEYIPLFKVQPIYPRRAQERGTQGYAIVSFTITESGSVEDAKAIEGYCGDPTGPESELRPCTMFNSASARAALKLRYKPKIVEGKAVAVNNVLHRFTYIMADD